MSDEIAEDLTNAEVFKEALKQTTDRSLEETAGRYAFNSLGQYHGKRSSKLGLSLKNWYWAAIVFFIITVGVCAAHSYWFAWIASSIHCAFLSLSVDDKMSVNQALIIYLISKITAISLFLLPLIWIFRRITSLQSLRSVHADKEALLATLELLLNSGYKIEPNLLESAISEIFSSSLQQTKSKKSDDNLTQILTLLRPLLKASDKS